MTKNRCAVLGLALAVVVLASACGGALGVTRKPNPKRPPPGPSPRQFLAVDKRARSVTVTLIAAYNGTNNGYNFDGYSRELLWTVPRGWTVHVICTNRGALRHSCAVVHGARTTTPAFSGAETAQPFVGLEAGASASFTFVAAKDGVYRFTCLVPGHEDARMWDPLKIVRGGKPSVTTLVGAA